MNESEARLLWSLRAMFYPFANLLLTNKIGVAPIIQQLKLAFVEAARKNHGTGGKPAATNRISNLTGMSRRHVADLLDDIDSQSLPSELSAPGQSHVLSVWCTNDKYTDELGLPKPLDLGPGPGTMHELISESLVEADTNDVIDSLLSAGCIKRNDEGRFELVERLFPMNRDLPRIISVFLSSMMSTIDKNWSRDKGQGLLMRAAHSDQIDPSRIPAVRRIIREEMSQLLERVDDRLSHYETAAGEPMYDEDGSELAQIGVAVYSFEVDKN